MSLASLRCRSAHHPEGPCPHGKPRASTITLMRRSPASDLEAEDASSDCCAGGLRDDPRTLWDEQAVVLVVPAAQRDGCARASRATKRSDVCHLEAGMAADAPLRALSTLSLVLSHPAGRSTDLRRPRRTARCLPSRGSTGSSRRRSATSAACTSRRACRSRSPCRPNGWWPPRRSRWT